TGFNSYSGPTTVSEGALGGTGNLETSTITVAADAAIAPGIGGIGVFYSGAVTFESGSTLVLEIDSTFDNADELSAYGNVDIRGAHVSFSEVGVGIIPAGSPPLIILDYSGAILTGTFVGYPEGSSVTVGANTFTLSYADFSCVTLTSTTVDPYDDWATGKGLDGSSGKDPAFDADPDLDGIDNGLEWILGGNPLAAEAEPRVRVAGSAQDGLTLTFTREETSLGIATLAVEWSDTLEDPWSEVTVEQSSVVDPNGVSVLVDEGPAPDAVTVHIPATLAPGGSLFARLRAILP
ncbi:MAG: hypothetical protein K9M97_07305, partial [Akkermansiaceae bacterium]|nr:hypothetical protein [Akkermansiaceae bacterium]